MSSLNVEQARIPQFIALFGVHKSVLLSHGLKDTLFSCALMCGGLNKNVEHTSKCVIELRRVDFHCGIYIYMLLIFLISLSFKFDLCV